MNLLRGRVIVLCVNNNGFFRPHSKKIDMSNLNKSKKSANYELENPHHPKHVECPDRKKQLIAKRKILIIQGTWSAHLPTDILISI